jgi:hypothetical protein
MPEFIGKLIIAVVAFILGNVLGIWLTREGNNVKHARSKHRQDR